MTETVVIAAGEIRPPMADVLAAQGVPPGVEITERLAGLYRRALEALESEAEPRGLLRPVTVPEFEEVFRGEGRNAAEAPLAGIFPRAARLALFAVTLGPAVTARIETLFGEGEYPLGAMLDAAASEATERAGDVLADRFRAAAGDPGRDALAGDDPGRRADAILRYSPGYCGWDMSGQRALFGTLDPGRIGISLRPSFLMDPLKSMTGVIVAGPPEIHRFDPDFPFCAECVSHGCRRRMQEAAAHRS